MNQLSMIVLLKLIIFFYLLKESNGLLTNLSTYETYSHSIELERNVAYLHWTVDDAHQSILFEYQVKTKGWIALGISSAGGMMGADIAVGWIDNSGKMYLQDRYSLNKSTPIIDNTTNDWFPIRGREENGWTVIQFKRLFDTCDDLDVPIKSGTNIVIFAYGVVDPNPVEMNGDITYHENRRGTRIIPLSSYADPPDEQSFSQFESFDFRLNNYNVPPTDTTYYCQIFRIPSQYTTKRHIIGYKILIDSSNSDLVHHMTTYECEISMNFDETSLPKGICDQITNTYSGCMSNIANGWAIGGDHMVEYTKLAGYPIGSESSAKYFMVQIHFDNPTLSSNRFDNSGIRFYLGKELRQNDLGYLTLGTYSDPSAIVIPPGVQRFQIDSFCPEKASRRFPVEGLTIVSAFPHTHLQGQSVSTKIIRNKSAIGYLFNAESFNFNYQFENQLTKPIQLFQGDTLVTRCVYNTINKNETTLGGQSTKDEMCSHSFTYYPRMNNLFLCVSMESYSSWQNLIDNSTANLNATQFINWLRNIQWTSELINKWQQTFSNGSKRILLGGSNQIEFDPEYEPLIYQDITVESCQHSSINNKSNSHDNRLFILLLLLLITKQIFAMK